MTTINQWAANNTWLAKMNTSKGLDGWDNYSGSSDFDQANWVVVISMSRDADIMETSNFESTLELLGGESKNVHVAQFGHWACGWIQTILVNPKSKTKLKIAFDIRQGLDDYPLVNEDDYYERENEYRSECANENKENLAKALSKHFGIKNNKSLVQIAYDLNMQCQSYYGDDACINIYTIHKPDSSDIKQLKTCLDQLGYNYKDSETYVKLCKTVLEYN